MKATRVLSSAALLAAVGMVLASPAAAQSAWDYRVRADVGYRWKINFNGSQDLYRSHIDLGEGPKLFSGDILLTQPTDQGGLFDHLELRMNSWGGEPYNTAHFVMGKADIYELRFNYLNTQYFSAIPSLSNPFFDEGDPESQLRYNTKRKNMLLELSLLPGRTISPFVSYHRFSHKGAVRNTLARGGDEFLLDTELDNSSDEVSGGVRLNFDPLVFRLEQGVRFFRDHTAAVAPMDQDGNSDRPLLGEDIVLDSLRSTNDFSTTAPFTRAAVTWAPLASLQLAGNVYYSMSSLDGTFAEQSAGNFFAFPPTSAFYGGATTSALVDAKEPMINGQVRAEWEPVHWFLLSEHFTTRRFHTSGVRELTSLLTDTDPLLGPPADQIDVKSSASTFMAVNQDLQELIGQFRVTPELQFRIGHRWERRELKLGVDRDLFQRTRNVLIVGLTYQFSSRNKISAEYELGRTDDNAIQRIDSQNFDRIRLVGRFSPLESLTFRGNINLFNHGNDEPEIDFSSRSDDLSLQVDFSPEAFVGVSAEYTRSRYRTSILYLVPQVLLPDRFRYMERGDYGAAHLRFNLPRSAQLSLGYSVWGNVGSFPLNFHQPYAELEVPLGERLSAYGRWNFYGYNEKVELLPQDYRTHLAVFGVRLAFDKPGP